MKIQNLLKKFIVICIIIINVIWSLPIQSFASNGNIDDTDNMREAIVPATANSILSQYISTDVSANTSTSTTDTNTYSETGDGYYSLTKVNGKVYKNYRQNLVSYAKTQKYFNYNKEDGTNTFGGSGCGPTSLAIIASGYGIDKTPGDIAKIITDKYGDYTTVSILSDVLEEIGVKNEYRTGDDAKTKIEKIRENLKSGNPVAICVENPGDGKYSSSTHWMALLDIDDSDNVTISNPWRTTGAEHINENGGVGDKGTTTANITDFINTYAAKSNYILVTQSKSSSSSSSSNSTSSSDEESSSETSSSTSSTEGKGETVKAVLTENGYESIYTNRSGRSFKEFKQNIKGSWNDINYPIPGTWGQECLMVSIMIISSGWNKDVNFATGQARLEKGAASSASDIKTWTGQDTRRETSKDNLISELKKGSVAIIHDPTYTSAGHYMAVLDINEAGTEVYISNPDIYGGHGLKGWTPISTLNSRPIDSVVYISNSGNTVDYGGEGGSSSGSSNSGSSSTVNVASNIVARDGGGYKVDINLNKVVDKMVKVIEENTDFRFKKYLSSKNQKKYLKNFLKAAIVTQYPDLRPASEIANGRTGIPDDEVQGCVVIKRYTDEETGKSFVRSGLSNPKDNEDNGMYLEYKPYEEFSELISSNDVSAIKYFSIDSSNNIVVAGWETMEVTVDGPNQTNVDAVGAIDRSQYNVTYTPKNENYQKLTMTSVDYLSQVSNYVMPFNLLWSLLVYSNDEDFANDVAELVIGSNITIGCYDATQTVVTKYTEEFSKKGIAEFTIYVDEIDQNTGSPTRAMKTVTKEVEYQFEVTEIDTLKTDTPALKLKYADIWTAVYNIDYEVDYDTKNSSDTSTLPDETIDTMYTQKRNGKYREEISDNNFKDKLDDEIESASKECLDELQEEVDRLNEGLSYRYTALEEEINKCEPTLATFLKKRAVENVIINLIIDQASEEEVNKSFSFSENNALEANGQETSSIYNQMVTYAKEVEKETGYNYGNLLEAAAGQVRGWVSDEELYNKITKDGTETTKAYTSKGISSTQITFQKKTTNRTQTIDIETTTATVNEKVTSDSKIRIKIDPKANEESFVKLLYNSPEANTNLYVISYWFFDSMESTANITDFTDLMKYLFYNVYDVDYNVSENMSDYVDIFDPEKMFNLTETTTTQLTGGTVEEQVWNYFRSAGFSEESTAGIMGNFYQESGMNPTIDGGAAAGICMFEKATGCFSEYQAYANSKGKEWTDLQSQLEYLMTQLPSAFNTYTGNGTYTYNNGTVTWWPEAMTLDEYKTLTDVEKATEIFCRVYERPSVPMMERRKNAAQDYYNLYHGK